MNIFITGGSRGIGRVIVLKLVKEGNGCAFTYSGNKAGADETIKQAREINPSVPVRSYQLDVKNPDQVEKVIEEAIKDFVNIDGVVNNAAVVRNNAAALMSNEEWNEVIATNLTGPFYVCRTFLMHFISNRFGRIINISSLAQTGCSGQVNYAASKAGLIGLTKTLAKEYGSKGITANVVTVGYVQTDMTKDNMAETLHKFWLRHCPVKKITDAEDIAELVWFLCTKRTEFINGEVINVSGGLTYAP
ncbi:MAG: SDR family oxidoreductase [bacterium]|nr:SDR family oxidoreductase [bacterium]